MTRKRSLQEKIKTTKEIQERYSPTSNFYKELDKVKAEYQNLLDEELVRLQLTKKNKKSKK